MVSFKESYHVRLSKPRSTGVLIVFHEQQTAPFGTSLHGYLGAAFIVVEVVMVPQFVHQRVYLRAGQ